MDKTISPYLRGYNSFLAVRSDGDGKHPAVEKGESWKDKLFSWEKGNQKLKEGCNVGLAFDGKGFFGLDDDTGELTPKIKEFLPATYEEQTCSGGRHFIFECNEPLTNLEIKWHNKHIGELRAVNQYIVISPSKAKSKIDGQFKEYVVLTDCSPALVTKQDIEKLLNPYEKTQQKGKIKLTNDVLAQIESDGEIKKLFYGDCSGFPTRSEAEQSLVGKLVSRGFNKETIFSIMANSKTDKWKEKSLSYRTLTFDKAVALVTEEKQNWKDGKNILLQSEGLGVISATELLHSKEKYNSIVEGLIYQNEITQVTGQTGHYKSLYCLYEAICIARGLKLLGHFPSKQNNVLILSAENSKLTDKMRVKSILSGLSIRKPKGLFFLTRDKCGNLLSEHFKKNLIYEIEKNNIKILYLDTANPLFPEIDDNKAKEVVGVFNNFFKPFVDKYGLTIRYLFHTDKQGKKYLGSVKWKANADNEWFVERTEEHGNEILISNEKTRNTEFENLKIRIVATRINEHYIKTNFLLIEQKGIGRKTKRRLTKTEQVKNIIRENLSNKKPKSFNELKEIVVKRGFSISTFKSQALKELLITNQIKKIVGGYCLT